MAVAAKSPAIRRLKSRFSTTPESEFSYLSAPAGEARAKGAAPGLGGGSSLASSNPFLEIAQRAGKSGFEGLPVRGLLDKLLEAPAAGPAPNDPGGLSEFPPNDPGGLSELPIVTGGFPAEDPLFAGAGFTQDIPMGAAAAASGGFSGLSGAEASLAALAEHGGTAAAASSGALNAAQLAEIGGYLAALYGIGSTAADSGLEDMTKGIYSAAYAAAPFTYGATALIPLIGGFLGMGRKGLTNEQRQALDVATQTPKVNTLPAELQSSTNFRELWDRMVWAGSGNTGGARSPSVGLWANTSDPNKYIAPTYGVNAQLGSGYTGPESNVGALVGKPNEHYATWKPEYFFEQMWRDPASLQASIQAGPQPHTFGDIESLTRAMVQNEMADYIRQGQSFTTGWEDYYKQPGTGAAPPMPPPPDPTTVPGTATYVNEAPESGPGFFGRGGLVRDRSRRPGGEEPIMAHEGEMVMNPAASRAHRNELTRMNEAGRGGSPRNEMAKVKRLILEFHRGQRPNEP